MLNERRTFLKRGSIGLGSAALASVLQDHAIAQPSGSPRSPHFPARAKRVVFLCMAGGPSHLETLDHKPKLAAMHGQAMPGSFTQGQPIAQLQGKELKCFGPQHPFQKFGNSGQSICSLFPHFGQIADEMCIIRSLRTEQINHDPAHTFINTGTAISGRPSIGAWLQYGLGNMSDNLPGFVVMSSIGKFGQSQPIAARQWHSGFLPSRHQGVEFRSAGDPVLYVNNPHGVDREVQGDVVNTINRLNRLHDNVVDDPEIAARIAQNELAFRMQASVPELMNVADEPQHILELYGTPGADGSFAGNCLLARRLLERGVRFVQLYHRGWDHHGGIKKNMVGTAGEVDQPAAALVLWRGGELDLGPARRWFLLILLSVGLSNYALTRFGVAALLATAGQALLLLPQLPLRLAVPAWHFSAGIACLSMAILGVWYQTRDDRVRERGWNRVWQDFRNGFGMVWSLRVMERMNHTATLADWKSELTWFEFTKVDEVSDTDLVERERAMRTLLRRFVSNDWIDQRLE